MKKIFVLLFAVICISYHNVYAEGIYYTNSMGVSFTKEQYDFYTYLTHDGFQEHVTQEMLNEIANEDLDNIEVEVVRICPTSKVVNRRDDNTYISSGAKSLTMGKYCVSGVCRIISEAEWLAEPNVKSYDVMGAFLDGPTRLGTPDVFVSSSDDFSYEEIIKYENDGFGAIVKIPTGDDVMIDLTFVYQNTGTIFVSYQHAMVGITFANSQLFNIDYFGYGNVFDFYGSAVGVYDNMPGVHMDV